MTHMATSYICTKYDPKFVNLALTKLSHNTTTTILWPFVRDYTGEPVPEETLTHPPS